MILALIPVLRSVLAQPRSLATSLPVTSEGSSVSLLDIGVLINTGTLRSLDKSVKLKLIKQAPDANFNYPTKFMHDCKRRFKPEWAKSRSWLHYSPSEDGIYWAIPFNKHTPPTDDTNF